MTPDQYTNQELMLDVGDGHTLYVQDWGKQAAEKPILYVHGGPGGSVKNSNRKFFNPLKQRVIFFDQRGSGKSLPYGELKNNTTQHMIADINTIAQELDLQEFILTGGSWGSCLALAYAIEHPEKVCGLVLNGIFTGSEDEATWLFGGGWRDMYPEVWVNFIASVPSEHHDDPASYYFNQITSNDTSKLHDALYALQNLEGALIKLNDHFQPDDRDSFDPTAASIEMHYTTNNFFMTDRRILNNADKITAPTWLIQGRYDMVCRPKIAYELDKVLPNSQLIWTINGHIGEHETATATKLALQHLTEGTA